MRRLGTALLAFGLTAALALVLSAQLAPGWAPASDLPSLDPDPLPAAGTCQEGSITKTTLPGADLPTWLVVPAVQETAPDIAAVLVPGAGPGTRDRLLPAAESLAACGIPSATYDKPAGVLRRDFDAWGQTAAQVVAATRTATGARQVAAVGWSEGGWVAARLADDADLMVTLGAPMVTPTEQLTWQADSLLAQAPEALRRIPATVLSRPGGPAWTRDDIRPLLAHAEIPILGVWGSADHVVPVSAAVRRLRETAPQASVLVLDGGDHALGGAGAGQGQTHWAPHVAGWLRDPEPGVVRGVEPEARHGLPAPPRPTWATHPLIHLALALAAAIIAGSLVRGHTPRRTP